MNPLAELDQLNLEPTTKTEVAALIQSLVEQVERDAKLIQAKDIKIGALTDELAYYKRIRFSQAWLRCSGMCSRKPGIPICRPSRPKSNSGKTMALAKQ